MGARPLGAGGIVLLAVVCVELPASATEHPTLVSVNAARCDACHDDLVEGAEVVHPPVADDCTSCHEFSISDTGTEVSLAEAEPALCVMCHDDLEAAMQGELASPHFPVTDSCLTCHDPHATEHAKLLVEAPAALCTTCHDSSDIDASHDGQLTTATNCSQCHAPHGSANDRMLLGSHQHRPFADGSCSGCHRAPFGERIRLRSRGERLCEACHGDIAEESVEEAVTVHAALKGERTRAGCLSCHDPHMSAQPAMLVESAPQLCGGCHEGVVSEATADTGHAPAGEDCLTCHLPHASAESALLSGPALELCEMCHDFEDETLTEAHLGASLDGLDCLSCHTPHGSGHQALLATNLHAPVLDGCDTCHEGAADQLMEDGESSLCLVCHDDPAADVEVPHGALEIATCADCHNPHAAAQPKLVKAPRGEVCAECHEDQVAGDGEVAHGIVELVGCEACHEPHGGDREVLLRADPDQLCLSCHDPRRVDVPEDGSEALLLGRFPVSAELARRTASLALSSDGTQHHPIRNHRTLGQPTDDELAHTDTTFEGELGCLSCHDPHKGRSRLIFRWGAANQLETCLQCHPK